MRQPLALLLLALALPLGAAQAQSRLEGFGQWQGRSNECRRNLAGADPTACMGVQLNQRMEGLLTVSFVARGEAKGSLSQLTFVGELQPGSVPMACRDGRCTPKGPMQLSLTSVSETSFDGRGLAEGLPRAWPATGRCQVDGPRFRCEARALSGEQWQAEATSS